MHHHRHRHHCRLSFAFCLFFGFICPVGWLVIGRDAGRCTDLVGVMYLYRSFLGRLQWSVAITSTLKPAVIDFTRSLA